MGARGVGDVNGDGFADIALGAVRADSNGFIDNGAVYVVFGHASGPTTIEGTVARETLAGTSASNTIVAGQGDDSVKAGRGADSVHGGHGDDVIRGHADDDRLFGDVGNDILIGGDGDNLLRGGDGNDKLMAASGADIVFGGDGNDTFFAAANDLGAGDRLFGGTGQRDILVISDSGTLGLTTLDMFTGIERIKTSAAGNTITGADSTQPTIWFGQSGADDLTGGSGQDIMRGGGGDDALSGGLGNNVLDGDNSRDTLTSGTGQDIFVFGVGEGVDTALDFEDGQDLIDFRAFNFSNFAGVQTKIATVNGETAITAGGSRLFLIGVDISDLDAVDFILYEMAPANLINPKSRPLSAISCMPMGRPSCVSPLGRLRAGQPAKLAGAQKSAWVTGWSPSNGNGGIGVVGRAMISTTVKLLRTRRRTSRT